ncbi:hypothetical protein V5799_033715 [Amblyomma americanum]|uniref:Evasin n=1 Tax=Amblyomma americanum TaxID=6943 RepID=A0AAQ4DMJ1_AMBAM
MTFTYSLAFILISDLECSCAVPSLLSPRNCTAYSIGCTYTCGNQSCTVGNGYPCYNLTLEAVMLQLNTSRTVKNCTAGVCVAGCCVPNGTVEDCFGVEATEPDFLRETSSLS